MPWSKVGNLKGPTGPVVSGTSSGQLLTWDGTAWGPKDPVVPASSDPQEIRVGDILSWNGNSWTAATFDIGATVHNLEPPKYGSNSVMPQDMLLWTNYSNGMHIFNWKDLDEYDNPVTNTATAFVYFYDRESGNKNVGTVTVISGTRSFSGLTNLQFRGEGFYLSTHNYYSSRFLQWVGGKGWQNADNLRGTSLPDGVLGEFLWFDGVQWKSSTTVAKVLPDTWETALGSNAETSGEDATAIGSYAKASLQGSSVGSESTAADLAVAIGQKSIANNNGAISIGFQSYSNGLSSISIGISSISNTEDSISIGNTANIGVGTSHNIAIGAEATAGSMGAGEGNSISLGHLAMSNAVGAIAIGLNAEISDETATRATAIGVDSTSTGAGSIAMGYGASSAGTNSIAIGTSARTTANNIIQLGTNTVSYRLRIGNRTVVTLEALKTVIAASTSFDDFKTRMAALTA